MDRTCLVEEREREREREREDRTDTSRGFGAWMETRIGWRLGKDMDSDRILTRIGLAPCGAVVAAPLEVAHAVRRVPPPEPPHPPPK
jgi:hypothetical protein